MAKYRLSRFFRTYGKQGITNRTFCRGAWKEKEISTPLELSENREALYLTRDIYGQEKPQPAEFAIEMYDLSTGEEAEELGTLLILPIR